MPVKTHVEGGDKGEIGQRTTNDRVKDVRGSRDFNDDRTQPCASGRGRVDLRFVVGLPIRARKLSEIWKEMRDTRATERFTKIQRENIKRFEP